MGRGESDESFHLEQVTNDHAVSNGYVRGSLSVIEGGRQTPGSFDNNELGANVDAATGTNDVSAPQAEVLTLPATAGKQLDLEYVVQEERTERIRMARMKGYEGDACTECGNFTMVRNGTCLKCDTCGTTSGCS